MRKPITVLLLVLLVIILFLSLPLPVSRNIKSTVVEISSPLLRFSGKFIDKAAAVFFRIKNVYQKAIENDKLRRELAVLRGERSGWLEAQKENARLRKLFDIKAALSHKTITCRVIGRDAGSWNSTIIIDKGKEAGLAVDSPVLSAGGVIGRIISCSRGTATVMLISDLNSSIGALVQETRSVGLVEGQGDGRCLLNLLPKKVHIPLRATVVTSGLGRIFPKGLLIGKVTAVGEGLQDLYQVAELELAADLDRLEEILVIVNKQ